MPDSSLAHSSSSCFASGGTAAAVRRWHARISSARARTTRCISPAIFAAAVEAPSCLFVGSIETASQDMLEALYEQARDSYYSGKPLIFDDMFDKVELKLRLYGSKSVVKYPRCSLMRQSTYADAEVPHVVSLYLLCFLERPSGPHMGVLHAAAAPSLSRLPKSLGEPHRSGPPITTLNPTT